MNAYLAQRSVVIALAALWAALAGAATVHGALFDDYAVYDQRQLWLPDVSDAGHLQAASVMDTLADGRLLVVTTRDSNTIKQDASDALPQLFLQSAAGSKQFDWVADLPLADPPLGDVPWIDYAGAFLSVSPSGHRVAVGNNLGTVGVFSTRELRPEGSPPAVTWFDLYDDAADYVDEFDAAWIGDRLLAVSHLPWANGSPDDARISILDTRSSPDDVVFDAVIDGLFASAGVAVDTAGAIYTAEGYRVDGYLATGTVKRFSATQWQDARNEGTPLDFRYRGSLVPPSGQAYSSAGSLLLDAAGHLLIGGGLLGSGTDQTEGFAVVRPVSGTARRFDPADPSHEQENFYSLTYNDVTGDIFAVEPFGASSNVPVDNRLVHVISPHATLPDGVVGRFVFYNDSWFDQPADGHDDSIQQAVDYGAIAPDKTALLPGGQATSENVTSYVHGINGVVIDVMDLAHPESIGLNDFHFATGNDDNPNGWAAGPAPEQVVVRPDAGVFGADRILLVWGADAVRDAWLQVTVRDTFDTGLTAPDVFYFGNAVGDTGNADTNALVTAADVIGVRDHPRGASNRTWLDDPFDFNRDRLVNAADALVARNGVTSPFSALRMIDLPAAAPPTTTAVPEPTTAALLLVAVVLTALLQHRTARNNGSCS